MPSIDCESIREMPLTEVEIDALAEERHAALHVLGGQPGVVPDDDDDGDVDRGEDVDRHRARRERAKKQHDEAERRDGERATEREPDDPHGNSGGFVTRTGRWSTRPAHPACQPSRAPRHAAGRGRPCRPAQNPYWKPSSGPAVGSNPLPWNEAFSRTAAVNAARSENW